jgi:hypothetical protein
MCHPVDVVKHIIVERLRPGREDEFVALAVRLRVLMGERGWNQYTAWRMVAGDEGEPGMFDVGILGRAQQRDGNIVGFDCDFADRAALEAQLHAMRTDADAVKIIVQAAEMVESESSRAYIFEDWWPAMPEASGAPSPPSSEG